MFVNVELLYVWTLRICIFIVLIDMYMWNIHISDHICCVCCLPQRNTTNTNVKVLRLTTTTNVPSVQAHGFRKRRLQMTKPIQ